MTVGILTLGCKVNTYESEFIKEKLIQAGYELKDFDDICDIYIINTCTVTNTSDIKSRKMIRKAIQKNSDACIIAMGCFIEANHDFNIEGVDILLGNRDKSKIVDIIDEYFKNKKQIQRLYQEEACEFEDMYLSEFPGRTRAFVKVQDGCENYCSYCIIPFVRGKCRSKKFELVLKEVEDLVKNGYQEVVLTGIHTGNYGVDLEENFADLLRALIKIKNLSRLRISSIEITELTDEVLDVILDKNIIVDHLHIPLQAGSDEILKLMRRKYDLSYFADKLNKIRSKCPDISITTDVIVGFPGESEKLFQKTLETCEKLSFSKIHVFPYSERKGTAAMKLEGHLPTTEKKKRARKLLELSKGLEINYAKKFVGSRRKVLIEEVKDGYSYGHTSNYLRVKVKGELSHNQFYDIDLKAVEYPNVLGKIGR